MDICFIFFYVIYAIAITNANSIQCMYIGRQIYLQFPYYEMEQINTIVFEQTNWKLKKYQNALSSFSFSNSKIFYLLVFNFMNYKKKISIYDCQKQNL